MTSYWELLQNPRWQEMRLRVLDRDKFACRECRSTDKTLHVHHTYYAKGKKPWEYEMESLITLCADCHADAEADLQELRRLVGLLDAGNRPVVLGYLRASLHIDTFGHQPLKVDSHAEAIGAADAYGVWMDDVMDARREDGTVDGVRLTNLRMNRRTILHTHYAIEALDALGEKDQPSG